ncbi:MAG TPA: Ig-like domain repeat protein [Solirubrobacterales bacterium]
MKTGIVGLAIGLVLALVAPAAALAAPEVWAFGYSGEPQVFTVPSGVTELSMTAIGGSGLSAGSAIGGGAAGVSGLAYGRFPVTPGEELTIWVGERGLSPGGATSVAWGFGCGGKGGEGLGFGSENGGGGGGASAVTQGAFTVNPEDCTHRPEAADILLVGGGGGGGGANHWIFPDHEVFFGGFGGDGGSPARAGGAGTGAAQGGCGECQTSFAGQNGFNNPFVIPAGGGGGAGGGGMLGGGGGQVFFNGAGGGGGGGSSFVGPGAEHSAYLGGYGDDSGDVILSALPTEFFQCTESVQAMTVPAGAGQMEIEASGGQGGSPGPGIGGVGGLGGTADGTVSVKPGKPVNVWVGCGGGPSRTFGWGWSPGGEGGHAPSTYAIDGGGGGGSSAVVVGSQLSVVAAGGGGGGGNAEVFGKYVEGGGPHGGTGGHGGVPAVAGAKGEPEGYAGGDGGEIDRFEGGEGGTGDDAADLSLAGAGGGGGAGWFGAGGGHDGKYIFPGEGGGGGGGGGGLSGATTAVTDFQAGTSLLSGAGSVALTFIPTPAAAIGVYSGSKQQVTIGGRFPQPLEALVTYASGKPVAGAQVTFELPSSGASGTFAGPTRTETVATGANGVAVSSPITANVTAGAWAAKASVAAVAAPAGFSLANVPSVTTTHLTASDDPATPTEPVTFTAHVTAATDMAGTPAGVVRFQVDGSAVGSPVALAEGSATSAPDSGLTPGTHTVEALYEGATSYLPSSGSLELPVEKTATAAEVTSSDNPALPGESMTFTTKVTVPPGNEPYDGAVQFSVDGTPLGGPRTATGGVATSPPFETTATGDHTIVAGVAETADYLGSEGRMIEVVDPDGTAVEVGATANPAEYGQPLELKAKVVPRPPVTLTPTGTVAFSVAGTGCTGTLAGGATACAPAAAIAPGEHEVGAHYSGDGEYEPGEGAMQLRVTKARTRTSVDGSPAAESVYGEPVRFHATVGRAHAGGDTPSGAVRFRFDGEPLGSPVSLESGAASSVALTPNAGPHVAGAAYGGDADFDPSSGQASYRVLPAPTEITLAGSPQPSQPGEPVAITALVKAKLVGSGEPPLPKGEVQFRLDGLDFGSPVPLVEGRAPAGPVEGLEPGRHDIEAIYVPANGNFLAGHAQIVHEVDQPTATFLVSSRDPAPPGAPVQVTAHVGPLVPVGTVGFTLDGTPIPSCQAIPIDEEDASCKLTGLAPGEHQVLAAYSGAPLFDSSQATLAQTVEAAPPSPPTACLPRDIRGRVLVFRSRQAFRLVTRYRASVPGNVTVRFYARGKGGKRGELLGAVHHEFDREGVVRLRRHLSAAKIDRLRRRHGFIAVFEVAASSGYCARRYETDLTIRRRVSAQQVWFEDESTRSALPPNSG